MKALLLLLAVVVPGFAQSPQPVRLLGKVVSVERGGLVVLCEPSTVAPKPPATASTKRPQPVHGKFFVAGHPKQSSMVDLDPVDVDAFETGIYKANDDSTLRKFVVKPFEAPTPVPATTAAKGPTPKPGWQPKGTALDQKKPKR